MKHGDRRLISTHTVHASLRPAESVIKKKVCMLGAFAAGKTSLVRQFATGLFSEKYLTTIGVRIEKKSLELQGRTMDMILWDLHSEDEFQKVRQTYLRGAAGCIYVVDGTRAETVDVVLTLKATIEAAYPPKPSIVLVNKSDRKSAWEVDEDDLRRLGNVGAPVFEVSAKSGDQVDAGFIALAGKLLEVE